jgi:hypothetical protein
LLGISDLYDPAFAKNEANHQKANPDQQLLNDGFTHFFVELAREFLKGKLCRFFGDELLDMISNSMRAGIC